MKILISADTYYPHVNGASYFSQRLAHYLQKKGHEVAVLAPSQRFSKTEEITNGIKVYGVTSFPVFFYPQFRFASPVFIKGHLRKTVENFKPDVVHLQNHFTLGRQLLTVCEEKNIPIVATNHFMPENLIHYLPVPSSLKKMICDLAWYDFARIFNRVGQITTPTETAAKLIRHRFEAPVKSISCGIDLQRFNSENNGEHLKKLYNIPNRPILLYVGRLDKEKNLDLVLKAVAVASLKTDFQFVIAGTGSEKNNLVNLADSLGIKDKVTFAGFVPDNELANLYAISSCFIIAGTAELQSIVTMEAMASGLPVIGVKAVALPELVYDQENGFHFEDGDIGDLAEKIFRIFSDKELRLKMGKRSLELIQKHDIKNSISAFEDIYRKELAKYKRGGENYIPL